MTAPGGLAIRRYRAADAGPAAALFFRAVREGAARAYSPAQCAAWAPAVPETARWHERMAGGISLVATRGGRLAGFMTLSRIGAAGPGSAHLDLAFVAPEEMGQGTAGALHEALLAEARAAGISRLTTEASRQARPFLARRGWQVLREQVAVRAGVSLPNTVMALALG
ncbi:hypothetical protein LNKW23_03320 [Paralimibaculum aggregatum]|uniref:N-acetyltransferase domain-containing protein n=1 Tax=Paralimibaculum aggregatum TaxID=3036245 RepID=A0ABQ6LCM1_9RHOB|nr:GNAT family N-acetyltransferase [Limibaculum sp. NKW23]GMG81120.1 hypothetical protein LNKW23_03320 [Limibaculum sp. NKW23]